MKKVLLTLNAILHGILYSLSMFYLGFQYGESTHHQRIYDGPGWWWIFPAVHLILLVMGVCIMLLHKDNTPKIYCETGIATLIFISIFCAWWFPSTRKALQGNVPFVDLWNFVLYPWITFAISAVIAVFYFLCAAITRKENRRRFG